MKLVHKYPMLGSSQNPEKLSLTIKAMLLALVPAFIALGRYSGLEIVEADLVQFINTAFTIASLVGVCIGLVRKNIP